MPQTTKPTSGRAKKPVSTRKTTQRKSSKTSANRSYSLRPHHIGALALLIVGLVWAAIMLIGQPLRNSEAATCSVSDKLVNSCRPWLGAAVNNYPVNDSVKAQMLDHESRIGRKLDIVHTYHPVGNNKLSDDDIFFAKREGTMLFANWKPTAKWAKANGSDAGTNQDIDQFANSVKSLGNTKIFLTLNHEAENDVSGGATCSKAFVGSKGTPAEYRAMWKNVRNRFDKLGIKNVVWVQDYMNYEPWNCLINELYPGDDLVDWVMFNAYGVKNETFASQVQNMYDFLGKNSSGNHNYNSKPWGIVEWGIENPTTEQGVNYYNSAKSIVESNKFPRLKAYMIYDALDKGNAGGDNYRVGYSTAGKSNETAAAYKAFATKVATMNNGGGTDPGNGGGGGTKPNPKPGKDTVPPTIKPIRPANNSTESGGLNIAAEASDNVGVTAVTLRIDDKYIETDDHNPYTFRIDTREWGNGKHTIAMRAWDKADNMSETKLTVTFKNEGGGKNKDYTKSSSTTVTTATIGSTPIKGQGTLIIEPMTAGNSVQVWVNGKLQKNNTIDLSSLTNGEHTIKVSENGIVSFQKVNVQNPATLASLNHVKAYAGTYGALCAIVLAIAGTIVLRPYIFGLTSMRERRLVKAQRSAKK